MPGRSNIVSRIGFAGLLLSGCWVEQEAVSDAIWSDDDEMIAIALLRYEVRQRDAGESSSDTEARSYTYQIYIMPSDLSEEPRALTDRFEDLGGYYLMSEAGYLLVKHGDDTYQYFLNGDSRRIFDRERLGELTDADERRSYLVLPSPRGDIIAIQHRQGMDSVESTIILIDADSLSLLAQEDGLPDGRIIWQPDDTLILLPYHSDQALGLSAGTSEWIPVSEPACKWPPTTSGPVAESGEIIGPGTDLDDPVEFDAIIGESAGHPNVPFGCP